MNGFRIELISNERIKRDGKQIEELKKIFNESYNGIPSFCRGISKEYVETIFSSLEKLLQQVKQAKGVEKERLYSDFKNQFKLAASMVNSYAQAYASWKEGISKGTTFLGEMVGVKEGMSFVDNLVSASMTALMFSGTVLRTAKVGSKPFIQYIQKKKIEEFIRKEILFQTKLAANSRSFNILEHIPSISVPKKSGKFAVAELSEFFSNPQLVSLLNISPAQRTNFILKTMLSTVDTAKLTESQKIIYTAMSKIDFSVHKIHQVHKILQDALKDISKLANKKDAGKIYNEVLDFINDFENARNKVSLSLLFDAPNAINKYKLESYLTNQALINYKKSLSIALKEKRSGGLPLGDYFRHEMGNILTFPKVVGSFLREEIQNIKALRVITK